MKCSTYKEVGWQDNEMLKCSSCKEVGWQTLSMNEDVQEAFQMWPVLFGALSAQILIINIQ